jgi:hypothetical protein
MISQKAGQFSIRRYLALVLLAAVSWSVASAESQKKAPASKPSAPAPKPAATKPSTPAGGHSATTGGANGGHTTTGGAASHSQAPHSTTSTVKAPPGGHVQQTKNGGTVAKNSRGQVTAYKGANGSEAKFGSNGKVTEVHSKVGGNDVTVRRGPGGVRRTEVVRADHSRVVAYGHGHGYIEHRYEYGGHPYYARGYYYNGGYYRGYYHPYYYNGVYLTGYMPAYYYPPVYYGWAYNPWPAPVAYGWGWGAAPWYGYYGAYFAPYPVYPSAAFWIVDYMVAASLAEAYAAAVASASGGAPQINPARLVYASYDPATDTTSPTMTKEVKDAVADEVKLELAAGQKTADPASGKAGSLEELLADGKPHVFVASAGLTVSSSGSDCGLTEGDVLALNAPPSKDATTADLRVLASKKDDCLKGNVVTVELTDLQEMHNHLLSNIDKGMAEMKDHPGQGGLPAPPAEAISGTKQAPYAAAAPAADPDGAAELDQTAQQGAQVEQQVVAEATAPDSSDTTAQAAQSPIGAVAPTSQPAAAAPAAPKGPAVIALGQTPDEVIAAKGQPTSKFNGPNKVVYIYPDMKITFKNGKLTDVE